jgi:flagellar hook-associated protein 3 FlgL
MIHDLVTGGLAASRESHFRAQSVASSGMRVEKPSDDPVAAGEARGLRSIERRRDAVAKTSAEAIDRLQQVDETLGQAGGLLTRVREIALMGANDHTSPLDRAVMADEVASLRQQLSSLANTRVDGEYVFSGLATDRPAFDATGAFTGEATLRQIEVGPGLRLPTQVSGAEVFGGAGGGVDAFATLDALEAALRADDPDAVHALLDDVEGAVGQVAQGQASVGHAQGALMQARAVAERARDEALRRRAELTEADPVEAFTDLVKTEQALREALAIAARMPPPSLVEMGG